MNGEAPLFSHILLSLKIMTEAQLLELQAVVGQERQTRNQRKEPEDRAQDYEITAQVALTDLNVTPFDSQSVQFSLPELNNAELSLVDFALHSYLRCADISEGTSASERGKSGLSGGSLMTPILGPLRK